MSQEHRDCPFSCDFQEVLLCENPTNSSLIPTIIYPMPPQPTTAPGLIPGGVQDVEELEAYNEIYHYRPPQIRNQQK